MINLIGAILRLIVMLFGAFMEGNKEKRKKKLEALNEVKTGIKNNDPSAITAGFDKVRNI